MDDEHSIPEGDVNLLINIDVDYVKQCSDEDTYFFIDLFLDKDTKNGKIKLHNHLNKRLMEFSDHIKECENSIELYTRKTISLRDDLKRMREKNNEYLDSFISIEKELYK